VSSVGIAADRWLRSIRQQPSHAHLSRDVSRLPPPPLRSRRARLDAIIVPASRPSCLQRTIELSAFLQAHLVVLCSRDAKVDNVVEQVSKSPGAKSLVVEISESWNHPGLPGRTSSLAFLKASNHRQSDLSAKRNIGLLLARLRGWSKIVFIDDDITSLENADILRLARQLEYHQVAGMVIKKHPDNSVVCHARRLAGLWQDVFVSGAVLGVRCNDLPLSFFPNIYNEDWFFFAKEAAAHKLPSVGYAKQAEYDPFASPNRARWEEFGDIVAEGLYALFGAQGRRVPFDKRLDMATKTYWSCFIEDRRNVINEVIKALYRSLRDDPNNGHICSAINSLAAAKRQLKDTIKPEVCVNFLDAWREDLTHWQRFSSRVNVAGSIHEAMEFLHIETSAWAQLGTSAVDMQKASDQPSSNRSRMPSRRRRSDRSKAGKNWRSPVGLKPSP
jgi:glycosyltransferase involved in cell wall biosynthesis